MKATHVRECFFYGFLCFLLYLGGTLYSTLADVGGAKGAGTGGGADGGVWTAPKTEENWTKSVSLGLAPALGSAKGASLGRPPVDGAPNIFSKSPASILPAGVPLAGPVLAAGSGSVGSSAHSSRSTLSETSFRFHGAFSVSSMGAGL